MSRTPLEQLILDALDNDGPMTARMLREVVIELNGDRHIEERDFEAAVLRLIAADQVEEREHEDARARQGGAPAEYRIKG